MIDIIVTLLVVTGVVAVVGTGLLAIALRLYGQSVRECPRCGRASEVGPMGWLACRCGARWWPNGLPVTSECLTCGGSGYVDDKVEVEK